MRLSMSRSMTLFFTLGTTFGCLHNPHHDSERALQHQKIADEVYSLASKGQSPAAIARLKSVPDDELEFTSVSKIDGKVRVFYDYPKQKLIAYLEAVGSLYHDGCSELVEKTVEEMTEKIKCYHTRMKSLTPVSIWDVPAADHYASPYVTVFDVGLVPPFRAHALPLDFSGELLLAQYFQPTLTALQTKQEKQAKESARKYYNGFGQINQRLCLYYNELRQEMNAFVDNDGAYNTLTSSQGLQPVSRLAHLVVDREKQVETDTRMISQLSGREWTPMHCYENLSVIHDTILAR